MESSNLGYSTYLSGTGGEILECSEIVVYNKQEIPDLEKIYIYNLEKVYKDVIDSGKYERILEDEFGKFPYDGTTEKISGFNVIIYIGRLGKPIGYTEFFGTQGKDSSVLNLIFNFSLTPIKISVEIVNSLSQLYQTKDIIPSNNQIGDKPLEYLQKKDFKTEITDLSSQVVPEYVPSQDAIKNNEEGIVLSRGFVNKDCFIRNSIRFGIRINQYNTVFNRYQVFYYKGDIAIIEWGDELNYNILSLTKTNVFDNPISYTPSQVGYLTIPDKSSIDKASKIVKVFGEIGEILLSTGKIDYYDMIQRKWLDLSGVNKVIRNRSDVKEIRRKFLKGVINLSTITTNFPELINTRYKYTGSDEVIDWIGDWIVFKKTEEKLVYSSQTFTLTINQGEEVEVVNNNLLLLKKNSGEYFLISDFNKDLDSDSIEGDSFKEGDLIVRSSLNRFRKSYLESIDQKIPKIDCSFLGLLFYVENDILKYL